MAVWGGSGGSGDIFGGSGFDFWGVAGGVSDSGAASGRGGSGGGFAV